MKEFVIEKQGVELKLNLATKISEITKEYLLAVTDDVVVAPYHAVIATVYRCKLPEVISSNKKSRAMAIAIVPLFVKANVPLETEKATFDLISSLDCTDKIIIAGSDIERGYQISTPKNVITIDNIVKIYNHDNNFAKNTMADQNYYYFVDFKLVPINDIKGYYKNSNPSEFINPFVTNISAPTN